MSLPTPESFKLEPEYDFVIVGSGGASMCAALYAKEAGLNPVILEKLDKIGGSTGYSGGVWWIPNNPVIKRAGVQDSPELAHKYFESVVDFVGKGTSPKRRDAFIDEGPKMVEFLESEGMKFEYPDGWADYYDDRPGGQPRGRSLMAEPYDANALGPWKDKLSLYLPFLGAPFGSFKMLQILLFKRTWKARRAFANVVLATIANKLSGRFVVTSGGAIQARMLEMTLKHNIPIFTGFAADKLIEEDGRVTAVEGVYEGARTQVRGHFGVLLNTGGFARNEEMRQKYHPQPSHAAWTNANPGDTGEMLEEAIRHGADTENLDTSVWIPSSMNPDGSMPEGAIGKDGKPYPFMHNADIAAPHFIMVDRSGNRLFNEANSYMEIGETMYAKGAVPMFAIFDERHMKRYAWGPILPGMKPVEKWLESGFLTKADTIDELAKKVGIDPAGLAAQIERYNRYSEKGVDEEFHKGERAYDRFRGDPTVKPNSCLGSIAQPPFYAIHIFPSDVGTFGGVVSDERARVLRKDGSVIEGLYAAGNCTSSVMGRTYLGAGASISPSFIFGFIAAKDAVQKSHNVMAKSA